MSLTDHDRYQKLTWNDRIFKPGTQFPKERCFYTSYTPLNGSIFSIQDPKEAMARRNLINPYFSRQSTRRAEPLIQNLCSQFLSKLQAAAWKETGNVVNLSKGFQGLASDTVMTFTFNKPLGALESPDFDFGVTRALKEGAVVGQWTVYFPSSFKMLLRAIDMLPLWLVDKYMPPLALTKFLLRVSSLRSPFPGSSNDIANHRFPANAF